MEPITSPFLRRLLLLDAAASGATGLLMLLITGWLAQWLALPAELLRGAGLVLVPYVAFVTYLGLSERAPRAAIWAVVVANGLWATASLGLLLSGWVAPSALGYAFIVAQALVVAMFGELQYIALRRQPATT